MSSWRGLSRVPRRRVSSAAVTILPWPTGRPGVILEDDSPIVRGGRRLRRAREASSCSDARSPARTRRRSGRIDALLAPSARRGVVEIARCSTPDRATHLAHRGRARGRARPRWRSAAAHRVAALVGALGSSPIALGTELADSLVGAVPRDAAPRSTRSGAHLEGRSCRWCVGYVAGAGAVAHATDAYETRRRARALARRCSVAAPCCSAASLRNRTRLNRALREKRARLERERAERAEAAAGRSARGSPASCTTSSPTR